MFLISGCKNQKVNKIHFCQRHLSNVMTHFIFLIIVNISHNIYFTYPVNYERNVMISIRTCESHAQVSVLECLMTHN